MVAFPWFEFIILGLVTSVCRLLHNMTTTFMRLDGCTFLSIIIPNDWLFSWRDTIEPFRLRMNPEQGIYRVSERDEDGRMVLCGRLVVTLG